ncbi:MAG: tRNA (adenosine(37)-N6)-threonylcarbamoyltransferase complex dimerization subunit type 1 TsaB [Pseudomonadota bacterium]
MQILAIEAASPLCSAALFIQGVTYERCRLVPQGHGQWLLPMIDGLLEEGNTTLGESSAIAFGRGPGTFTGVRMATAVAQGLAFGVDVPVLPVSTLQMLAQGVHKDTDVDKVVVATDARMDEVYWASFDCSSGMASPISDEVLCKPGQVPSLSGAGWYGVGSGFKQYPKLSEVYSDQLIHIDGERLPRAEDALPIAVEMFERGELVDAENAAPVYLRNDVAWK